MYANVLARLTGSRGAKDFLLSQAQQATLCAGNPLQESSVRNLNSHDRALVLWKSPNGDQGGGRCVSERWFVTRMGTPYSAGW